MYEKADTSSIGFLNSLYRYHTKCGLDISTLSDEQFCQEMAYLQKIRQQEFDYSVNNTLSKIMG